MRDLVAVIDFDGVIHGYTRGWLDGRIYDPPVPGTVDGLRKLKAAGIRIVVFSTRPFDRNSSEGQTQLAQMKAWLEQYGVPYDEIWEQAGKPRGFVYLDDRGLRFEGDWDEAVEKILALCDQERKRNC